MLQVTERDTKPAVSRAAAKLFLRMEKDDAGEDQLVDLLVEAATREAERFTNGRLAVPTTLVQTFNDFCFPLELEAFPVRSVEGFRYLDDAGDLQTISSSLYIVRNTHKGAEIHPADDFETVDLNGVETGRIQVTFEAGYDIPKEPSGSPINPELQMPGNMQMAILQTAAHWYRNRESVLVGTSAQEMPQSAKELLFGLRFFR